MKVAILGYGIEGQVACDYWRNGNDITVCDRDESLTLPAGVAGQLGADYLTGLDTYDVIVRSPGIKPSDIAAANGQDVLAKVTTVMNEFLQACPTSNVIGVTGTKGKGTTSTLITKMLEADGKKVYLGGNIGLPPLAFLKELDSESWVVLELSSFQLIDIKSSPHIAVCLMVAPEHLDWHADVEEYYQAKSQLFRWQSPDDIAIYFADNDNSKQIASSSAGHKVPYFAPPGAYVENDTIVVGGQTICQTSELKLLGRHNWQNVCAAVTAFWQASQNVEAIRQVLTTFTGLEHRLELVRELNGVRYYDDSFGTTPETAIVAVQAFDQPKVVILGGSDKGASYEEMAKVVASSNVRKAVLIGNQAPRIQQALENAGFNDFVAGGNTMTQIVSNCQKLAQPGDIVILSTGCASFDLFKNYKDRGAQFKQAVQALQ